MLCDFILQNSPRNILHLRKAFCQAIAYFQTILSEFGPQAQTNDSNNLQTAKLKGNNLKLEVSVYAIILIILVQRALAAFKTFYQSFAPMDLYYQLLLFCMHSISLQTKH